MAYTLQAIVGKAIKELSVPFGLQVIEMPFGFYMCPLDSDSRKRLDVPFCPYTDDGEEEPMIVSQLHNVCISLSTNGPIAYLEAELFGGDGLQAGLVYDQGEIAEGMTRGRWAINEVLKRLGVIRHGMRDEFDTLGLGLYRDTDDWIKSNNDAN